MSNHTATAGASSAHYMPSEQALHQVTELDLIVSRKDGRAVLSRVYFPSDQGTFPVIIFSHGFGSDLSAFAWTSRFWAAHGYVVIHPTHADSLAHGDMIGERKALMQRYIGALMIGRRNTTDQAAFVELLNDPSIVESRLSDIKAVLTALCDEASAPSALRGRCDSRRAGIAGHSYGAYTTLVLGGATLTRPDGKSASHLDAAFLAYLTISSQGTGRMSLGARAFEQITRPMLSITGTRDFGADGETPDWRLEAFRQSPPGDKYALVMKNFSHIQFDPALQGPASLSSGDDLRLIELAFWDAYLKRDPQAKAFLSQLSTDVDGGLFRFERR